MDESDFQRLKGAAFVLSLVAVVVMERLTPWGKFRGPGSGILRNVTLGGLDAGLMTAVCAGCSCAAARWAESRGIGLFNVIETPRWLSALAVIAAFDALAWAWHRANHVVPVLWSFHRVHHSDLAFDATTSFRFHPGELALALPVRLAMVVALGAPVIAILLFEAVFGFFNLFVHGNLRLPARLESLLEPVFIHPALHRVHHSTSPAESNTNFGTIFSVWDRVTGTLLSVRSSREVGVGLEGVPSERVTGVVAQLTLPFHG